MPRDNKDVDLVDAALTNVVDEFRLAMLRRLRAKERAGWSGWGDPSLELDFRNRLIQSFVRGNWVDVANFAAFLWEFNGRRRK